MTPIKPFPDLLIVTAVVAGAGYFVWRLDNAWDYDKSVRDKKK